MRVFIFAILVVAFASAKPLTFHYKGGEIIVNQKTRLPASGPIFIEEDRLGARLFLTGIQDNGPAMFEFVANISSIAYNESFFLAQGQFFKGKWGTKNPVYMEGGFFINGTLENLSFFGFCFDERTNTTYNFTINATFSKCPYFIPPQAAMRALRIVGQSAEVFKPVDVPNFALFGYSFEGSPKSCDWYLKNFDDANETIPGYVVVGLDGKHCGVFDNEGTKFVHSNPTTKKVALTSNVQLSRFFPNGFVIKSYSCAQTY